ncbi:hypothetical protein ACPWSR_11770 [Alloiococcus sp. CFN-8]|uniref:hypothetical protein n=1 Tax=Alloiococcus sp. CFN-8 TaxID=3416081 RepID=UPI003CF0A1C5
MKIDFTSRQYRALVQLLKFNMEFFKEADSKEFKEYLSLIQYILGHEELSRVLEPKSEEERAYELLAGESLAVLKESYDEAVFWKGLCRRMVAEKLFEECEDLNSDNIEEYANKRKSLEDTLLKSFKNGEFSIRE